MNRIWKRIRSKVYEWRHMVGMLAWDAVMGVSLIALLHFA